MSAAGNPVGVRIRRASAHALVASCALCTLAGAPSASQAGEPGADPPRLTFNAEEVAAQWANIVQTLRNQPLELRAARANEIINRRIQYDGDLAIWGKREYWATPLQTLTQGRGIARISPLQSTLPCSKRGCRMRSCA